MTQSWTIIRGKTLYNFGNNIHDWQFYDAGLTYITLQGAFMKL
jgi:hypothetical protein